MKIDELIQELEKVRQKHGNQKIYNIKGMRNGVGMLGGDTKLHGIEVFLGDKDDITLYSINI